MCTIKDIQVAKAQAEKEVHETINKHINKLKIMGADVSGIRLAFVDVTVFGDTKNVVLFTSVSFDVKI